MKKLRLLFSLCLAVVFGLGSAWAQTGTFPRQYVQEEDVDEIVDGMEVLFLPDAGQYHQGQFFGAALDAASGESLVTTQWSVADQPSDNSIFIIEECEGEFEDSFGSYPTYRIKNMATGYYIAAKHLLNEGETDVTWTNDPKKAFVCTILRSAYTTDEEGANPRESTAPEGNNAQSVPNIGVTWIIADTDPQEGGIDDDGNPLKALYLCGYGDKAALSQYSDTNQWQICKYSETTEYRNALSEIIFNLHYGSEEDIRAKFPIGTAPGMYTDAAAVQALVDLFAEFEAWSSMDGVATYDECSALYARFVAARAAIDASEVKFQAGHYYAFISVKNGGVPYVRKSPSSKGSVVGADAHTFGEEITADDAQYIWQLEDAGEGYFYMRGYVTGKYPVFPSSGIITQLSDTPVDGAIYSIEVSPYTSERCFKISPKSNSGTGWNMYNTGNDGVGAWGSFASDAGSNWRVLEISEETIKGLEAEIAQKELNDELAELYPQASVIYNKGRVYGSDQAANDGIFTTPADGFVTSESQLWSADTDPEEGSIAALLDGEYRTFFHSNWHTPASNGYYHTLGVDLGSAQQTIAMKYVKRLKATVVDHGTAPKMFNLYATNDTTTATGQWNYIGSYEFTYGQSINAPKTDKEEDKENIVEFAKAAGMIGMDMQAPYRYIRIEVTTKGDGSANAAENGIVANFFDLGELRVYTGKFDAEASTNYNKVPAEIRDAFETAFAAATTQYLNKTATREVVDNLKSAYEAFRAAYPDETRVRDAVAEAKAAVKVYSDAEVIGEGLGMYPTEAKETFDATMATVEEAINSDMSVDEINELVAAAQQAVADFEASLTIPEAGKIYALRGLTDVEKNKMSVNSLVTDYSNDYNTGLVYTVDTLDVKIDVASALNYLWKVEKSSLKEGVVLRNLATGFYMDTVAVLNKGIRTSVEPVALPVQSAKAPHAFLLTVGYDQDTNKPLYANFAGGRTNLVSWNDVTDSNSRLGFEEVALSADPTEYNANWPIVAGKPNILTLPFSIYYGEDEFGNKAYTVLGEKATVDGDATLYTLELKAVEEGAALEAGVPFIVIGAEEAPYFRMTLNGEVNAYDVPYVKEAVNAEDAILVGTMTGVQLDWNQVGLMTFRNGNAVFITSEQAERTRISGNSGYIKAATTTETGDVSIELRRSIASGIEDATVVDNNAKVDVYTVSGVQVRKAVKAATATNGLPAGLYIVGGKKVLVK